MDPEVDSIEEVPDTYLERFNRGLGYRPETDFKYVGGDHDCHWNWWNTVYPGRPMPPHSDFCLCEHSIVHNCYIEHYHTKEILVVGSCCIRRFMTHSGRTCTKCGESHHNRKDPWCDACRGGIMTSGIHLNKSFRTVLTRDPAYCYGILRNPPRRNTGLSTFYYWLIRENVRIPTVLSGNSLLTIGKYRNRSFQYIKDYDPGYCRWVRQTVSPGPGLKLFKEWLSE